jgi:hypothetical protein
VDADFLDLLPEKKEDWKNTAESEEDPEKEDTE